MNIMTLAPIAVEVEMVMSHCNVIIEVEFLGRLDALAVKHVEGVELLVEAEGL